MKVEIWLRDLAVLRPHRRALVGLRPGDGLVEQVVHLAAHADVFGSRGSAHIRSLCKWGPSSFTVRERRLPSGRPDEEASTLVQPDPTWALEYSAFKEMCADPSANAYGNTGKDIWIDASLASLAEQARQRFPE